jgi:hypothetical protein
VGEILSHLTAALPVDVSAGARLLALQCALRMNAYMRVGLPAGLLRSLRIDAVEACDELERARWVSVANGPGAVRFAAQLHDAALLAQTPARPDRRRTGDWALRTGCPTWIGGVEPRLRLSGVYLAARSDPSSGEGLSEGDRIIRDCGLPDQGFHDVFSRLISALMASCTQQNVAYEELKTKRISKLFGLPSTPQTPSATRQSGWHNDRPTGTRGKEPLSPLPWPMSLTGLRTGVHEGDRRVKQRECQPAFNYEYLPTIPARPRDARPWPLAIYGCQNECGTYVRDSVTSVSGWRTVG